jgi:exopolyphosphatase/guanosine-5'-triphosphate,3'-diphosphate pyrophosphatase
MAILGCASAWQTLTCRQMEPIRRAVIDVGTNSVKLLVADAAGRDVQPVREESKQTRLGHSFYETHRLRPEAIAATVRAVAGFAATARQCQALSIRVIATSAAREAVNASELTAAIQRASGLKVEVISGDQEADWGFQGVTTDSQLAHAPLLLLDVGGGSTEFILGQGEHKSFRHSFPLGTVRLMEELPHADPPQPAELAGCRRWLREFLRKEVRPKLRGPTRLCQNPSPGGRASSRAQTSSQIRAREDARPPDYAGGVQLVGVGGTASILGCMEGRLGTFDRARLEATRLSAARVSWHLEHLWSLALKERKQIVGLPKNRADVILMGVAIYQAVMEEFGFRELRISTRGLRFAAVMDSSGDYGEPTA